MIQSNRSMVHDMTPPAFTPGKYRHYKGWEYEAIGVACHETEMKWMVVYKPLYPHEGAPDLWVRPYEEFLSLVELDGQMVPRFTFVK